VNTGTLDFNSVIRRSLRSMAGAMWLALLVYVLSVSSSRAQLNASDQHYLNLYKASIEKALGRPYIGAWGMGETLQSYVYRYDITGNPAFLRAGITGYRRLKKKFLSTSMGVPDGFTGRIAPVMLTTRNSCGQTVAFLAHFSVVSEPAVALLHRYLKHPGINLSKAQLQRVYTDLRQVETGLRHFSDRMRWNGDRLSYAVPALSRLNRCKKFKAFIESRRLPLNMITAAGQLHVVLAELYRDFPNLRPAGRPNHRTIYRGIMAYTLSLMKWKGNHLTWPYRPGGRVEDVAHASKTIDFVMQGRNYDPQSVPNRIVKRLARTFHFVYGSGIGDIRSHLSNNDKRRGQLRFSVGLSRWTSLIPADPAIYRKIKHLRDNLLTKKATYAARSVYVEASLAYFGRQIHGVPAPRGEARPRPPRMPDPYAGQPPPPAMPAPRPYAAQPPVPTMAPPPRRRHNIYPEASAVINNSEVLHPFGALRQSRETILYRTRDSLPFRVDGQEVSSCIAYRFREFARRPVSVVAYHTGRDFGVDSCRAEFCGTAPGLHAFIRARNGDWRFTESLPLGPRPSEFTVSGPWPYNEIMLCRSAAGEARDNVALNTIYRN